MILRAMASALPRHCAGSASSTASSAAGACSTDQTSAPSWRHSAGPRGCSTSAVAVATSRRAFPPRRREEGHDVRWSCRPRRSSDRGRLGKGDGPARVPPNGCLDPSHRGRAVRHRPLEPRDPSPRSTRTRGLRRRHARAVERDRRALRHPPKPAGVRALRGRNHPVRAGNVPAHGWAALHPAQLYADELATALGGPWTVTARAPFRVVARAAGRG